MDCYFHKEFYDKQIFIQDEYNSHKEKLNKIKKKLEIIFIN